MKTFRTKLKSSLAITLAVFAFPLMAKPVAQVIEVKGQVFVVTPEGNTRTLKVNDHVEEKSEVMVGEDGDVTLNDYYDATYHLIQGSHLKFFNKSVQLKKGKTWIKSVGARTPLVLTTANAYVDYTKGEFITTFDQGSSKTQVLVVNGELEVSNVLDKNMKSVVMAGNFTIVDPEVENGLPRSQTKVGLVSLNKALVEFKTLPENLKETAPTITRGIASVPAEMKPVLKSAPKPAVQGQIVFMTNGKVATAVRTPASVKKTVGFDKIDGAPIRFIGVESVSQAPLKVRTPASIKTQSSVQNAKKIETDLNIDEFNNSLRNELASQPKHTKDLENLIRDLKSY